MSRAHPADGVLRAYVDGELSPLATLRCAWHLRRCASCRAALAEERRLERHASELIARLGVGVDVDEAWQRFSALYGPGPRRALSAWPAVGIAAVVVLTAVVLLAPRTRAGDGSGGPAAVTAQDVCCWDLDGGGPGDDGVFTLSRRGQVVACVIVYDDIDASRSLSDPDVVRYVSRPGDCGKMMKSSWRNEPPIAGPVLAVHGTHTRPAD